ncbi:MAG: (E)-4-hydroxy-3-methylbut-2-enyl-diphosphate synthase [Salinivirgaceae bacterium]|nr:(E)-4-hydroxy-3-methylbut-2-enyl-diphosphate synthase [Salinivirgaceae bacterium]
MDFLTNNPYKTNAVTIGNLTIGGDSEIAIQTMCNTPAGDIKKGFEQALEAAEAGAQLIRFAVRNSTDAETLGEIRKLLNEAGIDTPLVADVHFNPQAAFVAARLIEKVRINPGNFMDKRATFEQTEYTEKQWQEELERLETTFSQFIDICKEHNTAIRIGVNHGSLSDRIMSRYGNTVEGMVESAMEFLRLCKKLNFNNVVVSLKSSNVRVMTTAYRLLIAKMETEGACYPLHLGVTEPGNGLAGRVRSAIGIGTLLADGIGDTIRVSLTEIPINELPAARKLVQYFKDRGDVPAIESSIEIDPYDYTFYKSHEVNGVGKENPIKVFCDVRTAKIIDKQLIESLGFIQKENQWYPTQRVADFIFVGNAEIKTNLPENLTMVFESSVTKVPSEEAIPLFSKAEYWQIASKAFNIVKFVTLTNTDLENPEIIEALQKDPNVIISLETVSQNGFADQRAAFIRLKMNNITAPVIIKRDYVTDDWEEQIMQSSADIGGLFLNGMGNGIWITNPFLQEVAETRDLMFEILQGARVRTSQTEFIACPSCGRTQFDIESVLAEVRNRTKHLAHLKIGVMGCIVNGPGEMADADYGYIGAAPNKIALYKGKNMVRKNIPANTAVEELITLIKQNGDWVDPQ